MAMREPLCGIFGGTFDPIHFGHIKPVYTAAHAAGLGKVIYIPTGTPPHRPPPTASAADRLAMVNLALSRASTDDVELTVDDIECKRRGPSYTIDTVQELRRREPRANHVLLLGLDALLNLESWHRWEELQRGIHIIGIARPGWRAPQPLPAWWRRAQVESTDALRDASAGTIRVVETATVNISATEVRDKIRAGRDIADCVPPAVRDYIRRHNLYAD